ncbi:MAG: hypothetical protein ACRD3O_11440 [Terriglobia bacterium]
MLISLHMEAKAGDRREPAGKPPRRVAADVEDNPPHRDMLPVWFFVGLIFLIYGILILITGLTELHHPPHTVLAAELHPTIWWGAILTTLGGFFIYWFGPWRR